MKALVVGYGSIGKRHTKNLLSTSEYDVIICTRQKTPELPNTNRCRKYASIKECLKEEPDVGFVTNVSSKHIETAKILANANCHLFIEKPLSNSLIGVNNLLTITKKKQIITQMGCNFRFHDCVKKIKEILLNNELGRVISARVEWGTYLPDWHPYEDYRTSYASRKDLGGGVVLTCIHEIDYLYWFFGDVKEVVAMTGTYSDLGIDVDDLAAIIMKFKNNVIAELHLDYFQRPDFRSCKIVGTKGTLYWDSETNEVRVYDIKSKKWITKLKIKNYNRNDMYVKEISHFIDCINNKKHTMNDLSQGIQTLKIALAIMKSSKEKKVIRV